MNGSRDVRRAVGTRIAYIHEHRIFLIELILGFVNLDLGNTHSSRVVSRSLFAIPNLGSAQKRKADESAHVEFLSPVVELQFGAINFTGFGV